ncbi:MAG TPA: alpha/beta family hydrolase [Usitatibacter sp.]|nr:alpha/beta family hydrolase [Usitatibacter sp.]
MGTAAKKVAIEVAGQGSVSGLLLAPAKPRALYVLAHGAGAGMEHPFMRAAADALFERGIATLRYQFPYMERGSKRPDSPAVAHAAVRGAVATAATLLPGTALFAGGKSFGGRMTSQAQAALPLEAVRGLVFLGFPLHAAGQPGDARAKHLEAVEVPMLFLQGTRDALADASLMRSLCERLGGKATLSFFEDADHSFHVPAKTGRTDAQVLAAVLDAMAAWIDAR